VTHSARLRSAALIRDAGRAATAQSANPNSFVLFRCLSVAGKMPVWGGCNRKDLYAKDFAGRLLPLNFVLLEWAADAC